MVAVVPMVSVFTEENGVDAAASTNSGVSDIKVQLFEKKDSTEPASYYADLIYCSNNTHNLPKSVNATQYVEMKGGVWMNVDEKSADYGKFLTYGKTGMTTAQILAQSEEGGNWLPLIQVSATYNSAFNWNVSVTKDGGASYGESGDIKLQKEGYDGTKYSFPATQVVSTIKISQAAATDSAYMGLGENIVGKYVVDVKVNGVSEKKETLTIGDYVKISGILSPAYGTYAIAGATIKYTVDGKEETAVSKETGVYDFKVLKGSVVVFKSITYPGDVFTFKGLKSLGTVTSDKVLEIKAEQSVTTVIVNDNSSTAVPIKDAKLTLSWYQEKENGSGKYYVKLVSGVAKICGNSDKNGVISVAYIKPTVEEGYKAILVGTASLASGDYYTFDANSVTQNTSGEGTSIASQLTKEGTKIIYSESETSPTFKAKESTLTVTVKEAGDENFVVGATVTASFYEVKDSTTSGKKDIKSLAGSIKSIGTTGEEGTVKLTYVAPTGTAGYSAYMLISATSAPGFTFANKIALTTGSTVDTIEKQIEGCSATVAITAGSPSPVVKAKETAFRVDVKATNVPAGKSVTFNYTDGIGTSVVSGKATASSSYVTACFYVLKDKSPAITATLDGYVLKCGKYTTWTVPTVTGDISTPIEFVATSTTETISLGIPNVYGSDGKVTNVSTGQRFSVSLPSIADNKPVTFEYTVDGVTYKNTVLSKDGIASLYVYSWNSIIAFTSVTAPGYTVSIVDGAIADGPAKVIKEYTITFKDGSAATANVVVGIDVAVYLDVDKAPIATVKANAIGVAKFKTEEIGAKMVYFKCNGVFVSKVFVDTTFAYDVDISAAIKAAPVKVTEYTVNYFATDVNANASDSDHTAYSMIMAPQIVNVGSDVKINAPEVSGYKFVGWMMDGKIVSADAEYTLNVTTNPLEKVNAIYEQHLVSEPKDGGIDSTTLIIGIAAVVIALIAVIYAVIQKKQ
ncbi:hypothetical protein [Candidatus Methanarcanum hacksteinii]|uniref:hypothetical protein n=1 Tax=Candidatus Methanarcanum hacksteinii TaxID=2911857 RepID=UPI0037DC719C